MGWVRASGVGYPFGEYNFYKINHPAIKFTLEAKATTFLAKAILFLTEATTFLIKATILLAKATTFLVKATILLAKATTFLVKATILLAKATTFLVKATILLAKAMIKEAKGIILSFSGFILSLPAIFFIVQTRHAVSLKIATELLFFAHHPTTDIVIIRTGEVQDGTTLHANRFSRTAGRENLMA